MTFKISVNVKPLREQAKRLEGVSEKTIENIEFRTVDSVTVRAYDNNRRRMNAGVQLDDAYITRRMELTPARKLGTVVTGTIEAGGSNLTMLSHYQPKIITQAAPRGKGNPKLGLPAGTKPAGVTVAVGTTRKLLAHGFLAKLRNGNGYGVFTRGTDGKIRNRYGPSVYQLLAYTIDQTKDEIADDLAATALREFEGLDL